MPAAFREPDSGGTAGAGVPDEGHASIRTECDHLGVAAVPGGPAVTVPIGRVRLSLLAGRAGGVGGGDRVGSPWAGAMDQEDAAGVAGQDDREGLLNGAGLVPGPAAGDQETERRAHRGGTHRPASASPPALLCRLAGNAETGGDVRPGVTGCPEPGHGLADGVVQLGGDAGHVADGVDIPGGDTAAVGGDDARRTKALYWSFSTNRPRRFGVNEALTLDRVPQLALVMGPCSFLGALVRGERPGAFTRQVPRLWSREWRSSCGCLMLWTGRGSTRAGCARVEGPGQRIMRSAAA
jgi:hypothetical protein